MRRIPRTLEDVKKYAEEPMETNPENEDLRDCTQNNTPFNVNGLPAVTIAPDQSYPRWMVENDWEFVPNFSY